MRKRADKVMRRRILLVSAVLGVLCFAVIAGRIFFLQVFRYEEYQQRAIDQQTKDIIIEAERGTIYDRNMKPLAISIGSEMVTVEGAKIGSRYNDSKELSDAEKETKTEEERRLIVRTLSDILELDYDTVLEKASKSSKYAVIKRKVEKEKADEIRRFISENKLNSVFLYSDTTRYYPYDNFLSHTIGFVGTDNQGLYGLESYYDDELNGVDGRVIKAANAKGGEMPFDYEMYYDAQNGNSLVLTIDEVIQHYLEKNLEMAYYDNKVADHVTGIVMDVNTGAVLAMANKPDFDLNSPFDIVNSWEAERIASIENSEERAKERSNVLTAQWLNNAVTYAYYPGSTFKIITASSALEDQAVLPSTTFYCPGYKQVWDRKIGCWNRRGHKNETLLQAIMNSCNPAFMEIGAKLGKADFYKYFKAFGLTEKTGIDLPGEVSGSFWDVSKMTDVDLAVASFGQNFEITPLQLITAVSAVANGGNLVTPHLVDKIIDENNSIISSADTNVVRQVISKETSELMCDMLREVATTGTGKNAYLAGYRVAGKTGTTEKIAKQIATGRNDLRISSFVAFAPADDPQIAVLVLLDEPTVPPVTGGVTVAPVIRRIMADVLPYLEIEPVYTEAEQKKIDSTIPNLSGMTIDQAKEAAGKVGLNVRRVGDGDTVTAQVPAYSATVSRGSTIVVYMGAEISGELVEVPDLSGFGVSATKQKLAQLGLYYRSHGTEYATGNVAVGRQDIAPWTQVPVGTVITVEFRDLNQTSQ